MFKQVILWRRLDSGGVVFIEPSGYRFHAVVRDRLDGGALVCWLVFFRNLLGTPFFTVSQASGEILLFRRRTREPWKRIPVSEISHFSIEKQFYTYDSEQAENAVLLLFTTAGERRALCGSPTSRSSGLWPKGSNSLQERASATAEPSDPAGHFLQELPYGKPEGGVRAPTPAQRKPARQVASPEPARFGLRRSR